MSLVPVKYPLDLTGAAVSNRVTNELHVLPGTNIRILVPNYGAFFTDSIALRDVATNRTLTKGVDYYPSILYTDPTARTGREIHQILVITDATCGANVMLDAQMLGGEYSFSYDAIVQLVKDLGLDSRTIQFDNIIGKPDGYPPAPHLHDAGDLYGFEYLSAAIDRLRDGVLLGSAAGQKGVYDYLNGQLANMQSVIDAMVQSRSTAQSIVNTLGYTPFNAAGGELFGRLTVDGYGYFKAGHREIVKQLTAASAVTKFNLSQANRFVVALNSNTTFQFDLTGITGLAGNDYLKFGVLIRNDAVGNRSIAFASPILWPNKTVPTRVAAANSISEYEFTTYDGGVTWIGKLVSSDVG
jgi:hypothetical protein